MLLLSAVGLTGIALDEGYRGQAYPDGGGVQTIGFGTTRTPDGRAVQAGDKTTPDRALVMLAHDVGATERALHACIGTVPLTPDEWDAYVRLAYNIGSGAFCRSSLVQKLKQTPPDYAGACREILRWDKDNGRVVPGLSARRAREYAQCLGNTPPAEATP